MKRFEFFDESGEDFDGWWDEVYSNGQGDHHCSLISILDYCVSLVDKIALSLLPEHSDWPEVNDYIFSEIDDLDITSVEEFLKDMGYDITIDGICIFKYETQYQGYLKSTTGEFNSLPIIVNKYNSDKVFISKLRQLLGDSGVKCSGEDTMTSFLNLVHIRDKVAEVLPYLGVDSSDI